MKIGFLQFGHFSYREESEIWEWETELRVQGQWERERWKQRIWCTKESLVSSQIQSRIQVRSAEFVCTNIVCVSVFSANWLQCCMNFGKRCNVWENWLVLMVRMNSFSVWYNYEGFGTVYGYVWSNPLVLVNQKGDIPCSNWWFNLVIVVNFNQTVLKSTPHVNFWFIFWFFLIFFIFYTCHFTVMPHVKMTQFGPYICF